jgi:putative ABC transport system permease protein
MRTLLVVLSIAVGVFAVGMIAGAYVIISNDMSASYASTNPANIEIWTQPFDNGLIKVLEKVEGVKEVEGRRFVNVRARAESKENNTWVSLDMVVPESFEDSRINQFRSIEGRSFPDQKELLLEQDTLEKLPTRVGEEIEVQLADGTLRLMRVAGIVQDQSTGAGDFLGSPLAFTTFDTLEWLNEREEFNRLWVTVAGDPNDETNIRQVADGISDKLEKSGRQVYRTQFSKTNEHPMTSTVQAVLGVLGFLGILIVFLSSSLIANTLSGLLNQHTRYIGVMKLVGAHSRQIIGLYIVLILAFGLIALVIAIPTGSRAAYALSELIADMLNFNLLGFRLTTLALITQVVIALTIPILAGLAPIYKGARISVKDAISGDMAVSGSAASSQNQPRNFAAKQSVRWISRPLLISLRNTFRRKGRLALTLFTLTMGGAIFIAVFNVRVALNQYIGNIGDYFLADVVITTDRPYRVKEIVQVAMQIPGVEAVEGWLFASGEILDPDGKLIENIQVLAPPAESELVNPILVSGRWLTPEDRNAIAVSEAILGDFPDLQPGDVLSMKVSGHEDDWTVVGIFKFVGIQGMLGYANYETIAELLGQTGRSFSFRISTDDHSEANQIRMASVVDEHFRGLGYQVNEVEPGNSMMKVASEGINTLTIFLLIMALLTALVGSIGLTGTMGMNVLERTREIGVMRSIGAVDWVVIKTVIVEGVVIGVISWFLGALLSFPITSLLSTIISLAIFETQIEVAFTVEGFLIWLVLVILLSAFASVIPARNAARLTIREVLAYE